MYTHLPCGPGCMHSIIMLMCVAPFTFRDTHAKPPSIHSAHHSNVQLQVSAHMTLFYP